MVKISIFSKQLFPFIKKNTNVVSLRKKYTEWKNIKGKLRVFLIFSILIISVFFFWYNLEIYFPFLFILCYKAFRLINQLSKYLEEKFYYRYKLLSFLKANKLYEEDYEEIQEKDKNGNIRMKREKYITNSAVLGWEILQNKLVILGFRRGDSLDKKVLNLDIELVGALNLQLEEKLVRPSVVEYHFFLKPPERLFVTSENNKSLNDSLEINLGYGVTYNPVKCPHILIAGGTGSGKSMLIGFLLTEFLKQRSMIYICDPKNSDLGSLSHYLGTEKVATSPNNIARVVRLAVSEMKERYEKMNENFKYGSNFSDHGYKATWVVFDEMGAFQASGIDKKSKEIVSEVMAGIKQIILLGRAAGVFILIAAQQMRAETLNTDLRDNLGLRIALGANSSEGYRMVFGSACPEEIPLIETKGSGLLYMQGACKTSAQYWESPYIDLNNYDFISELQSLISKEI